MPTLLLLESLVFVAAFVVGYSWAVYWFVHRPIMKAIDQLLKRREPLDRVQIDQRTRLNARSASRRRLTEMRRCGGSDVGHLVGDLHSRQGSIIVIEIGRRKTVADTIRSQ